MPKHHRLTFPLTFVAFVLCITALAAGLSHHWPRLASEWQRSWQDDTTPAELGYKEAP